MPAESLLATVQTILEQPTAPFHEDAVAREIERLLDECPHVTVTKDSFGNLIARYSRGRSKARFALAAHMDHPGWVSTKESGASAEEFLGGVPKEYFESNPARLNFGPFSMWDLPAFELRDGQIHSRACDDLIGCAAIVTMFQELERTEAKCTCLGLFTRAEEVGFVGAMRLAKSGLIPKEITILSLETSAERPPAKMGDGVIVRVGDRTSIFDPAVTAELTAVSQANNLRFQRCLMTGGTCEATAYALCGYRCGALCIALGNYHNCGPDNQIAQEFVSLADVENLTALCICLISQSPAATRRINPAATLKARLEKNLAEHRRFFRKLQ